MDPNATLAELRDWSRDPNADVARGQALVQAMDEWIMRNGFLPQDWHRAQLAALRRVPTAQG